MMRLTLLGSSDVRRLVFLWPFSTSRPDRSRKRVTTTPTSPAPAPDDPIHGCHSRQQSAGSTNADETMTQALGWVSKEVARHARHLRL